MEPRHFKFFLLIFISFVNIEPFLLFVLGVIFAFHVCKSWDSKGFSSCDVLLFIPLLIPSNFHFVPCKALSCAAIDVLHHILDLKNLDIFSAGETSGLLALRSLVTCAKCGFALLC